MQVLAILCRVYTRTIYTKLPSIKRKYRKRTKIGSENKYLLEMETQKLLKKKMSFYD